MKLLLYNYIYVPAVAMIAEDLCILVLVTTSLLVDKHSATLSVVTGLKLMVVSVSLQIATQLVGCDTTKLLCWVWGKELAIAVEELDNKSVDFKSMYAQRL